MIEFSILMPGIPSRLRRQAKLVRKLCAMIGDDPTVELLVWTDNKRRSIGRKRDDLIQMAQGRFLSFVDDDDDVPDYYVNAALEAIRADPDADVFAVDQECLWNGEGPFRVRFGVEHDEDEPMRRNPDGRWADLTRRISHSCIWRAELAKRVRVPEVNYYEDTEWAKEARALVKKQVRIQRVMHLYEFDDLVSEGHD